MFAIGLCAGDLVAIGLGAVSVAMGLGDGFGNTAVVHDIEVELKNVLGMTVKRTQFANRSSLAVQGGSLHVQTEGDSIQVPEETLDEQG